VGQDQFQALLGLLAAVAGVAGKKLIQEIEKHGLY
jgi:hypothetical protein